MEAINTSGRKSGVDETGKRKKVLINIAYIAVICVIGYFVFKYLLVWMMPFFIGFLCSLVLQKPVRWLSCKTRIPNGVWSAVLVTVILSLVFFLIGFAGYRIYNEMVSFIKDANIKLPEITQSFKDISNRFSRWSSSLPQSVSGTLESLPGDIMKKVITFLSDGVSGIAKTVITNGPGLLLTITITIVACCFMTARYRENMDFVLRQFSEKNRQVIIKAKGLFMENIVKMLRGYIIILLITCAELFIGFTILRLEYAFVLAMLIAIMDILPVVGTGTALIPWGVYQLIIGNVWMGLGLLVLYAAITVIRQIIEPKIIGKQVGLTPIVTLMAMYLGLQLFGIIGMVCLPILLIIIVKLQESGMIKIWK